MDPMAFILSVLPQPWSTYSLVLIGVGSILDAIVPAVDPSSPWAIPRAALHVCSLSFREAAHVLRRDNAP